MTTSIEFTDGHSHDEVWDTHMRLTLAGQKQLADLYIH